MNKAMKTCSNPLCGKTLPLDQFYKDRQKKDGHTSRCKECHSQHAAVYYQANTETILQQTAVYSKAHTPERRQRNNARRMANLDRFRQSSATYRLAHPERSRQLVRDSRKRHPETRRANELRRSARKRGAPICDFTADQWKAMKELYQYRCAYCGKKLQRLTQDHVTPLSKGGSHTWDNIVPACLPCNLKKYNKAPLTPVQGLLNIV